RGRPDPHLARTSRARGRSLLRLSRRTALVETHRRVPRIPGAEGRGREEQLGIFGHRRRRSGLLAWLLRLAARAPHLVVEHIPKSRDVLYLTIRQLPSACGHARPRATRCCPSTITVDSNS